MLILIWIRQGKRQREGEKRKEKMDRKTEEEVNLINVNMPHLTF
jgi:hypothetical protein